MHVLPRIIFRGVSAQGVNASKIETLFGEAGIREGKNREQLPSCANNVGSISKCVQADENYRDDHLSSQSIKQPKLYLEKKIVVSFTIHMCPFYVYAQRHLVIYCLANASWRRFSCNYFHAFSQKHLLSDGDAQEEN